MKWHCERPGRYTSEAGEVERLESGAWRGYCSTGSANGVSWAIYCLKLVDAKRDVEEAYQRGKEVEHA